ncbi:Aspartic proteinase 3 [Komagataella phaffii CBS 7435]|uniref:Aspartic protease, attached to the plasma membrane via a glycosylphosphatidylinositol (GPI) anchor n=2 Tax=Komagataella phaffii TaxID=460519 RepID=C4R458_KOMPG|nr:Aspartic protease, attached to the plasma membrane via a glycosylphosphatidylinositol (GPI) anchor [Komagataella phaffii GS115]AOA63862.1 GQ67_03363T0 [Komagataella phaffii]CAH2449909.1 Aspartic proteinase [Komagataella phaffii CBS 7435]AOA69165.1 GQ68_03332T0 [Komagataella phaffii GS115]CAY70344.1 Aspartic protease, attached to the plasma membrane via a glycosylphosphatidylinositol (GPI) anchor [Komagataella phaffii GS115]CCA39863.1 Aspartic proteinase 3 [Komagataella phaffii CBS 7435]
MLPIRLSKLLLLLSLKLKLGTAEEKYQKLDLKRIDKDYYAVDVKVGSDEQEIKEVLIDTGSSDFWILDKSFCNSPTSEEEENSNGRSNKESCGVYGSFDSNKSETFQATGQVFDAAYGDTTAESTGSSGVRGIDQLRVGDIHIEELYFGLVTNTTSLPPVLGIAQLSEEFSNNSYPNFPYQMKEEGLIDVVAYSLSLGQSKGELLFGAMDHSKYNGTLLKAPILQAGTPGMQVLLTGVALTNGSSSVFNETDNKGFIYFDSGTTASTLPSEHFDDLFNHHGWAYDGDTLTYSIQCDSEGEKSLLDFTLEYTIAGNIVIKVPFEDIIMKNENDGECLSTVMVSNQTSFSYSDDTPFFVAGDEVLLNAYVVYNLETQELAIAPAVDNPEDTEEDIEIISADFDISEARDYSVGLEFRNTTIPATTDYLPSSMSSGSVSEETGSKSESSTSEDFAAATLKPFTFWGFVLFFFHFLI